MQIALFQPDIPQNAGTILRLCACLDVAAHIIEPAGFPVSDRHFRRAGMDYLDQVSLTRHDSWSKFEQWRRDGGYRLPCSRPRAPVSYLDYRYGADDILLFGRESAGVPTTSPALPMPGWLSRSGPPALPEHRRRVGDGVGRGAAANRFRIQEAAR